ncbi:hypothetical protein SHKM778_76200 [Streptomyces sp. KM77-8]|uniref:Uncharacterized protein n=1 Tax=Streptomyces haneummycinicus TaxID=3074435 RepID=A0AAT9HUD9_9ACTN
MSVAAFGARALGRELARGGLGAPGLGRRVVRSAARAANPAWTQAVSQDALYPAVRGAAPPHLADRALTAYTRRLTRAATGSYAAASVLWSISSLRASPARMFHPTALLAAATGSPPPSADPH